MIVIAYKKFNGMGEMDAIRKVCGTHVCQLLHRNNSKEFRILDTCIHIFIEFSICSTSHYKPWCIKDLCFQYSCFRYHHIICCAAQLYLWFVTEFRFCPLLRRESITFFIGEITFVIFYLWDCTCFEFINVDVYM